MQALQSKIQTTFISTLVEKARQALSDIVKANSSAVTNKLNDSLQEVIRMHGLELAQKGHSRPPELIASIITAHMNAVAAKTALINLREYLTPLDSCASRRRV